MATASITTAQKEAAFEALMQELGNTNRVRAMTASTAEPAGITSTTIISFIIGAIGTNATVVAVLTTVRKYLVAQAQAAITAADATITRQQAIVTALTPTAVIAQESTMPQVG